MQLHGCLIHGIHTRILKKFNPWCLIHGYIHEFWKNSMKTKGTYMNFEKIQWKQSFHHQLTKVNCIKSNNTMKTNQLS